MDEAALSVSDSLKTFGLLACLLIVGVLAVALRLPEQAALVVIFAAALSEAYIVGRRYMRLRSEDVLIYVLALLPLAVVIAFAFVIVPDIVQHK